MTFTSADIPVWFILVNSHHRLVYDQSFCVDLPKDATIARLESNILQYLARSCASDSFSHFAIWRCTDLTETFTEGNRKALETEVKEHFRDNKIRKLVQRMKIQDLQLLESETLRVAATVARPVWYLTVDHEMRPIRKAAVTAIVQSIEDLAKSAKEGSPGVTISHVAN